MEQPSNKQSFSWEYYHTLVGELKKQIQRTPNIIVSIGKGGSIPGVLLAEMFDCNNLNLGLKSYEGTTRGHIHEYQSIDCYEALTDAEVLIVDDIADSGKTFEYATTKFKSQGCEKVKTAAVFYKPCSKFKPDYFAQEIEKDTWIVQPWE